MARSHKVSLYLYGILDITFFEGRSCIAETTLASSAPKVFKGTLKVFEKSLGLEQQCSDCYCIVTLHSARVARSSVIPRNSNPIWNERLRVFCAHEVTDVVVSVKDQDNVGAKTIGQVSFSVDSLLSGQLIEGWFTLLTPKGKVTKSKASIRLRLQFFSAETDLSYGRGVGDGSRVSSIRHTFFPLRAGCRVKLYQDAHIENNAFPQLGSVLTQPYEPARAWEDLYNDIKDARYFVYISGWAVNDHTVLIRDLDRTESQIGFGVSLGDLLIRKSEEGVKVLLMVWDDKFSTNAPFMQSGVMHTGDEKTSQFFKNTKVECWLCPRNPDKHLSMAQGFQIGNMFTHHQKTAVMDAPLSNTDPVNRRVIGYVGGLDICGGRFDTPSHSLFRSLNTPFHEEDFHQSCFPNPAIQKGGPRQPWHDIHSKVEGPIAWDVLFNFEQRWLKQAKNLENCLLAVTNVQEIVNPSPVIPEHDPSVWSVQLLRSIDSGSVMGFPTTHEEATEAGLVPGKGNIVDRSCQDAYIQAIRRSRNYIYIENQYFLGSCHLWEGDHNAGCTNLIPAEIMIKILKKIERGERYSAYIVVPMFPDGIPESGSVQAVLYWQRRTISMMYASIGRALMDNGMYGVHPRDYLSFFCLGNRETPGPGELAPSKPVESGSNYYYSQLNRRFMVYVHSKLMIVDDEFIIVGSANINQRSMDGSRDTELAMCAFQNHHTMDTSANGAPRGQVHAFRMALWAEHMGWLDHSFLEPQSLVCMRKVNEIAAQHWAAYVAENPVDMVGHLMNYPMAVGQDGSVASLSGYDFFPDTKAPVAGTKSGVLPEILTT